MSYDQNLPNARHFRNEHIVSVAAAVARRISFPYAVTIRGMYSIVNTASANAGAGLKLRDAAGTDIPNSTITHGTGAAGTKLDADGLAVDVAADTEIQIYSLAATDGVFNVVIEYEVKAGQALR